MLLLKKVKIFFDNGMTMKLEIYTSYQITQIQKLF